MHGQKLPRGSDSPLPVCLGPVVPMLSLPDSEKPVIFAVLVKERLLLRPLRGIQVAGQQV